MNEEKSLEGWAPTIGNGLGLADVIEHAFDYRGDVTVVCVDGRQVVGYVYNRDRHLGEPYLEMFEPSGGVVRLRYAEVLTVRFTGKDTAAGKSYEAWLRRKAEGAATTGA
jgi:hypothetical protein